MTAFFAAFFYLFFLPSVSQGTTVRQLLDLVKEKDSIIVADHAGRILLAKDVDVKRIPASTLKILTVLAAFHFLGPDYRFITEFYADRKANLKIKGYGDPLLISEVLQEISSVLARKITRCGCVIVDDSCFAKDITIPGVSGSANPYDAPLSALSANFNTIFFERNKGEIVSAEPQTPMPTYAIQRIGQNHKGDRISLFGNEHEAALYAGHLLLHFLKQNGVVCEGPVESGTVLAGDKLIYRHLSPFTIEDAAKSLLEFSNNFMANQITLVLGAEVFGLPATLDKGRQAVLNYVHNTLGLSGVRFAEGSGISRQNRLSARDMLRILKEFEPRRKLLMNKGSTYYKTGTLNGIQARAGYMETPEGQSSFVIFLNSPGGDSDRLLDLIVTKWGTSDSN